jgi:hypothetical protein
MILATNNHPPRAVCIRTASTHPLSSAAIAGKSLTRAYDEGGVRGGEQLRPTSVMLSSGGHCCWIHDLSFPGPETRQRNREINHYATSTRATLFCTNAGRRFIEPVTRSWSPVHSVATSISHVLVIIWF